MLLKIKNEANAVDFVAIIINETYNITALNRD